MAAARKAAVLAEHGVARGKAGVFVLAQPGGSVQPAPSAESSAGRMSTDSKRSSSTQAHPSTVRNPSLHAAAMSQRMAVGTGSG